VKYAKESIQFKSIMYIKPIPHGYMRYKKWARRKKYLQRVYNRKLKNARRKAAPV
jgi:hypothetical protein